MAIDPKALIGEAHKIHMEARTDLQSAGDSATDLARLEHLTDYLNRLRDAEAIAAQALGALSLATRQR